MKLNCIIVEDEPLAAKVIETYVSKIDGVTLIGKCDNVLDAFNILNKTQVDLMFLDIKMPQITGLDFLRTLKNPPKVILTTAYREYALEGYELDVIDYLLKPISFERFLKAINKVLNQPAPNQNVPRDNYAIIKDYKDIYMYLKSDKKMKKIYLKDILYIEGLKDYIVLITNNEKITTHTSLTYMEEKLPADKFIRIHRSYIVSMDKIKASSVTSIELAGKTFTIGRHYKQQVLKTLDKINLLQ